MRAVVVDQANAPFRLADVKWPSLGPGQVLVRIKASGVNPLDIKIREGSAAHARQPLPAILGIDLAGIVEEVDDGVTSFQPGDEVYGMTGGVGGLQGSLAEYATVDAALLAVKSSHLTLREAAALPLTVITAWEGLVDRAHVEAGQKVLVQGGSGGVGHIVIQLARAFGAEVFATASASNKALVESLGATFIDYRATTVEQYVAAHTNGRGFDIVFDTSGGAVLDASFNAIRRFGHVVSILGWGTHSLAPLSFRGGTYSGVFTLLPLLTGEGKAHHGEILREAARLSNEGKLKPILDPRHFTFESVEDAYTAIESRSASGKLVVDIAD